MLCWHVRGLAWTSQACPAGVPVAPRRAALKHAHPHPSARVPQARVWREGRHLEASIVLGVPQQLVPAHSHDVKPDYYIYAGGGMGAGWGWYGLGHDLVGGWNDRQVAGPIA